MPELTTTTATDNQWVAGPDGERSGSPAPAPATSPAPAIATKPATANTKSVAKTGAPRGNRNSYRHGLYSPRGPKGTMYTDRAANEFRRHLEDQVLAVHGEISTLAASLIQTAAEAARVAIAELTELREMLEAGAKDETKGLDPGQRTAKRAAALKALDLRDRKVKELGITFAPSATNSNDDPWQQFDQERQIDSAAPGKAPGRSGDFPPPESPNPAKVPPSFSEKPTSETSEAAA